MEMAWLLLIGGGAPRAFPVAVLRVVVVFVLDRGMLHSHHYRQAEDTTLLQLLLEHGGHG